MQKPLHTWVSKIQITRVVFVATYIVLDIEEIEGDAIVKVKVKDASDNLIETYGCARDEIEDTVKEILSEYSNIEVCGDFPLDRGTHVVPSNRS